MCDCSCFSGRYGCSCQLSYTSAGRNGETEHRPASAETLSNIQRLHCSSLQVFSVQKLAMATQTSQDWLQTRWWWLYKGCSVIYFQSYICVPRHISVLTPSEVPWGLGQDHAVMARWQHLGWQRDEWKNKDKSSYIASTFQLFQIRYRSLRLQVTWQTKSGPS